MEKRNSIRKAWIDPSALKATNETMFEYMPQGRSPKSEDREFFKTLFPYLERLATTEQVKSKPTARTVIGGVCSIFTGDMTQAGRAAEIVRMDQLIETVGLAPGMKTLFVAEDSLFAALTGIKLKTFQAQAYQVLNRLKIIAKQIGAEVEMVLTSEIESDLREQTTILAKLIGNENFLELQAAPVMLMYTQLWSELLNTLGYLDSPAVICIEPSLHFKRKQRFPDPKMQNAYWSFLEWLSEQPYAQPNSKNEQFEAAAFTPVGSPPNRTRLQPFQEVPNTSNWQRWLTQLEQKTNDSFIFPLQNSELFVAAVNYLRYDEETQQLLAKLALQEQDYYQEKDDLPQPKITRQTTKNEKRLQIKAAQQASQALKEEYQNRTAKIVTTLLTKLKNTFGKVLGDI